MDITQSPPVSPPPQKQRRKPVASGTSTKRTASTTISPLLREEAPSRHKSHSWLLVLRGWKTELCSVALSICAMVAVAGTLRHYDQAPTSEWRFVASLNAVVSILITTAKASILLSLAACLSQEKWRYFGSSQRLDRLDIFDDASRGPAGSTHLLWKLRFSSIPALIGALLTLLTLTMEPFAQQVIEITLRPVQSFNSTAAHVSYVHLSNATESLNSGVIKGILGGGSSPQYFCPSGNCTFPSFSTLGMCGKCQKVSVTSKCKSLLYNNYACNFTTPSKAILRYSIDDGVSDEYPPTLAPFIADDNSATGESCGVKGFIAGFGIAQPKNFSDPTWNKSDITSGYNYHECVFNMCERTFEHMTVSAGVPNALPRLSLDRPLYPTIWYKYIEATLTDYTLLSPNISDLTSWFASTEAGSSSDQNERDKRIPPQGKPLVYGLESGFELIKKLGGLFGEVEDSSNGVTSQDVVDNILHSSDLHATVQNISLFLTNALIANDPELTIGGSIFGVENHFNINWPWLILPALIVLGGALVLLVAIGKHRSKQTPLWKSSNLALALHDFHLQSRENTDGSSIGNARIQWEQAAASMRAKELERIGRRYEARIESGRPPGTEILIGSDGMAKDRISIGQFIGEETQASEDKGFGEKFRYRRRRRASDAGVVTLRENV